MIVIFIIGFFIVLMVLGLSILTINKGYSYQHKIDPLPQDKINEDQNQQDE
ncbi:YtzI protein [Aquibacillus sp. 3ASR75-11]|uniref:YtzI protein n=2 Tax=Terrihalobacillus insolitus TaxID=2950438 RepID=A0A9X4ALR5_9BACI|nr:YtzI protein [Terrihalobacillus insolitus]MDC3413571.1 YtzI protein [Terrihalobacillus insolitus]MDC3424672.1 YtzI protein [Terrihalobacillus insolitus]